MRQRRAELLHSEEYVEQILKDGAEKARTVAAKTLGRVRAAVGL